MEPKKTVVLGATPNPSRYAYLATNRLKEYNQPVVPVGIRQGEIGGTEILQGTPPIEEVDTVTLYLGAPRQKQYYEYILSLEPKRIIFNPGTENPELVQLAKEQGIESVRGCTLVMLAVGDY